MSRRLSLYRPYLWNAAETQLSARGLESSPFANAALLSSRTHSSHEWLERQRRDPYVKKAKYESYRARSAFKLLEIDEKYRIFRPGQIVLDLGAAPGSWCQVAVKAVNAVAPPEVETGGLLPRMVIRENDRTQRYYDGDTDALQATDSAAEAVAQSKRKTGLVIGVDLLPLAPVPGAIVLAESDFTDPKTQQTMRDLLKGQQVDVVLCDMAPNASGMKSLDHDVIIHLCKIALVFSLQVLVDNGTFLCKIWNGEQFKTFSDDLKKYFKLVRSVKPKACRDDSAELYLLSSGFQKSFLATNKNSPVYFVPASASLKTGFVFVVYFTEKAVLSFF